MAHDPATALPTSTGVGDPPDVPETGRATRVGTAMATAEAALPARTTLQTHTHMHTHTQAYTDIRPLPFVSRPSLLALSSPFTPCKSMFPSPPAGGAFPARGVAAGRGQGIQSSSRSAPSLCFPSRSRSLSRSLSLSRSRLTIFGSSLLSLLPVFVVVFAIRLASLGLRRRTRGCSPGLSVSQGPKTGCTSQCCGCCFRDWRQRSFWVVAGLLR